MKASWDEMSVWEQSLLLGYDQIRQYEEAEEFSAMMKVKGIM